MDDIQKEEWVHYGWCAEVEDICSSSTPPLIKLEIASYFIQTLPHPYHKIMLGTQDVVLKNLFERLRNYKLKLNLNKCVFGALSRKLLGFIVSNKGIEGDPDKIKVIQALSEPCREKEFCSFLGRLSYIARFIAKFYATSEPIFRLLRRSHKGKWDEECHKAFEKKIQRLSFKVASVISANALIDLWFSIWQHCQGQ